MAHRVSRVLAAVVVLALAPIVALSAGAAQAAGAASAAGMSRAAVSAVSVPRISCPTSLGASSPARALPHSQKVAVPTAAANRLAAYGDNQGEMFILGPRGWACQASVGADGSDAISVYPKGEFHPGSGWPKTAQAVTSEVIPACVGCILVQACPFFPSAERALQADFGKAMACPRRPARETVSRASATAVRFTDPPGVRGTGTPSGGPYPALGVVTYKPSTSKAAYGSWLETCTLPAGEQALCDGAIGEFLALWDSGSGG
ncbi:MAG TPA: DUF4850 domain-containing protein [Acidimicrobiales bacterium]|nr:DUF4850 domain-containing protein [Acidimicrobiales bacterium]